MKNFFKRIFGVADSLPTTNGVFSPRTSGRGALVLPAWARIAAEHSPKVSLCIEANTAGYIAEWFELLGVKKPDQYWLEVAYQCAKMDLQMSLVGTGYDPRTSRMPVEFHFSKAPEWALSRFEKGRGIIAASKGREARAHYKKVRGALPF